VGGRESLGQLTPSPAPGYEAHMKEGENSCPSFTARVWIDKAEAQWSKMDIECIDTVSPGLVPGAGFTKGSRIVIEQTRVKTMKCGCPGTSRSRWTCASPLLKNFNVEADQTFHGLQEVSALLRRILGVVEVQDK